jgi:hypothetical protein
MDAMPASPSLSFPRFGGKFFFFFTQVTCCSRVSSIFFHLGTQAERIAPIKSIRALGHREVLTGHMTAFKASSQSSICH